MLINYVFGSSNGNFEIDSNQLTLEALISEMQAREVYFEINETTVVHFSYKNEAGRNKGEFTETTLISLPPTGVVTITQQMRETKARAYSTEELADVIAEAKAALASNEFNALKSACRELRQVSEEVAKLIGNYTHYSKSTSDMFNAVERAVKFLSPDVLEVDVEDLQEIFARIEAIEAKVNALMNQEVSDEVQMILEDLAFVANHFDIMLPNHKELFIVK